MTKIAFIGAGSFGFTRSLVRDILTFPLLKDATLALMDIDPERLDFINRAVNRIVDDGKYPAKVMATMDRAEALKDADAVIVTILAGGVDVWQHDILIPKKYGVDTNVGDTRGPSGIFRALRTIPVMMGIVKDMEKYCPNAMMLNYTNPMAMLCRAMQRESFIQLTGLCHSVQGTAQMLAHWIGAPMDEITYTCAGINHLAWYIEVRVERQGRLSAHPQGHHRKRGHLQRGTGAQRDVPAPGLLRHRIQRAQLRVQLVVPQTARPDREILHARHGLESRPLRLHPRRIPQARR